jgi:ComF family protein
MLNWIESFTELFFPQLCVTCNRKLFSDETYVCIHCMQDFPKTGFHEVPENKVAQLFWGRTKVEYATSWLYFKKGSHYQKLVHYLKYKGFKELGAEMGYLFGHDLKDSVFAEVDMIMPVPLHRKKEKQRGYNQSEWIAKGMSDAMQKELSTGNLLRARFTQTQTRKTRFERWQNVEGIFEVINPEKISGKHILLVDDVVTTGSTLEAAVYTLLNSGAERVSISTLAMAD